MPYTFLPIFPSLTSGTSRSHPAEWQEVEHSQEARAPCYNRPAPGHAGVAELVDAPDSKSGSPQGECRFEPDLRYF